MDCFPFQDSLFTTEGLQNVPSKNLLLNSTDHLYKITDENKNKTNSSYPQSTNFTSNEVRYF